ncbi:hypothetical protein Afil01_43640 [Actinorhabdospora filicis]|uniref:Uncharacterized protein n=2 Tax=Actinorhabdospora filicis TaxID=1785913 RepID=A0A9W6SP73_9ACTN|nr:hypothetical protein Afil01_43640 [Actinorhabdospora filicis]
MEFLAGLRALTVRAPSPDASVHAVLGPGGTSVELGDTAGRDPGGLARQIAAALTRAQREYRDALCVLMGGEVPDAPPGPLVAGLEDALGAITVEAASPGGLARVRRHGAIGVSVELAPGAPGHPALPAELDAALRAADRAFAARFAS